jgi:hypothetical protein
MRQVQRRGTRMKVFSLLESQCVSSCQEAPLADRMASVAFIE